MGLTLKAKAAERATRLKSLGIRTARENAGMARDIVDLVFDNYAAGATWHDSVEAAKDAIAERALARYGPNIRAALAKAGLALPDGVALTPEAIKEVLSAQTGLDIDSLTGEGFARAIDSLLSQRLSDELGVPIDSVLQPEGLKLAVRAGVKLAIANGTAERLLTKGLTRAARIAVTWRRAGVSSKVEQRKILKSYAQKKYARTHQQIWVKTGQ